MVGRLSEDSQRTLSSVLIAVAIAAGLVFPGLASALFPYVMPALFFLVVFSLNSQADRATRIIATPDPFTGCAVLWQMFVVPFAITVGCTLFDAPKLLTTILVASTTAGSVFASPALVHIVGLDRNIAVRTMILSTFAMPVSLVVFGELNGILPPDMSFQHYFQQVVVFLVIPLLISVLFWQVRTRMSVRVEVGTLKCMHWGSTLTVMVFSCGLMDVIHANKKEHLHDILTYEALAILLAIAILLTTRMVFSQFGRRRAMTAAMLAANRNVALSFAMLSDVFPPQVITYVAVVQLPIFLAPLIARIVQLIRKSRQTGQGALS